MNYNLAQVTLYTNVPLDTKYENHPIHCSEFRNYDNDAIGMSTFSEFIDHQHYDSVKGVNVFDFNRSVYANINFIFNNLLRTSIILELENDNDINANYLAVEVDNNTYYYFIVNTEMLNAKTIKFELELDVLATYGSEFIKGMEGKAVFTERKHDNRFYRDSTSNETKFYCPDLLLNDTVLGNVEAQDMIKEPTQLVLSIYDKIKPNTALNNSFLKNLNWLYYSKHDDNTFMNMGEFQQAYGGGVLLPFTMGVMPIGFDGFEIYHEEETIVNQETGESTTIPLFVIRNNQQEMTNTLFKDTKKYSARVSPYAPFNFKAGSFGNIIKASIVEYDTHPYIQGKKLTYLQLQISSNVTNPIKFSYGDNQFAVFGLGENGFKVATNNPETITPSQGTTGYLFYNRDIQLVYQPNTTYDLEPISGDNLEIFKTNLPTTIPYIFEKNIELEPRLWCYPLYKVEVGCMSSQPIVIYPQIIYGGDGEKPYSTNASFKTIATCYGGDFAYFTYLKGEGSVYKYQNRLNQGLTTSPDYTFPYGEDALAKFNDTQGTSYATSKITQGITGGVMTIGGIALSVASGGTMSAPGIGMIGTGIGMMTGAVSESVSKYEDLKNTADTLQNMGGSFAHDMAHGYSLLPYISYSRVNAPLRKMYFEYFYNYGYMVNRNCIFNMSVNDWNNESGVDNKLFRREYFNYVKIKEDITSKIDSEFIPPVAKLKINEILNNGIKLWTFFHYDDYFGFDTATQKASTLSIRDRYLLEVYENSEYER